MFPFNTAERPVTRVRGAGRACVISPSTCHANVSLGRLCLFAKFAKIELRRREIDKHKLAQKKREHSQEEAEKDAIRKSVEGEKAWAETER